MLKASMQLCLHDEDVVCFRKLDKWRKKDLESPGMFQTPAWNIPQVAAVSRCVSNDLKQAAALGIKAN